VSKKIKFPSIKSAIVFFIKNGDELFANLFTHHAEAEYSKHEAPEPAPTQWRTIGLTFDIGGGFPLRQSNTITFAVQINERVLPAKVIDEHITKYIAELERKQHRRLGKKEFAEVKDEVVASLLPKAFIRRSVVLATLTSDGDLIIWTSSFKRADEIIAVLRPVLSNDLFIVQNCETVRPLSSVLTAFAVDEAGGLFDVGSSAVLVKEGDDDTPVIRIKDRSIASVEVQSALKQGYRVRELDLQYGDDLNFVVTDNFAFKRIAFDGQVREEGDSDDRIGAFESSLYATTAKLMLANNALIEECGGQVGIEDEDDL